MWQSLVGPAISMLGGAATQPPQVQQSNMLNKRRQYFQQLLSGLYPIMTDLNLEQSDIGNIFNLLGRR